MTANNHAAGNAAAGAAGVNNDRDGVSGGPSGFDEEDALVFVAEAAAMLIADDTAGGDGNVAAVGTRSLKNTVPRGGTERASRAGTTTMGGCGGNGDYANLAGAIFDDKGRHLLGPP